MFWLPLSQQKARKILAVFGQPINQIGEPFDVHKCNPDTNNVNCAKSRIKIS